MPRLECGCWTGIWNGTTPPAQCARHAARSAVLVLDPTRDVSVESVVQQAREATTHPPQLDLLGHHSMDQGTAEMISRMLIDGAPAPAIGQPERARGCARAPASSAAQLAQLIRSRRRQ